LFTREVRTITNSLTYFLLGVMVDDLRILDLTTKKQEKPFAITNEISIVKWNPKKVSY